jgi:hypothetical protein
MISTTWKLATVLGVMGAVALSAPSAEARTKRAAKNVQSTVTGAPNVYLPSHRGSYNYELAPTSRGFLDGRNGPSNYNRNASG